MANGHTVIPFFEGNMRKLWKTIFSRYFISAVLILAELALLFYLLFFAYGYSVYALILIAAVNVAAVISLINRDANPEYKVSWLVIVMLTPPFGMALYILFYSRRVSKKKARIMREIQDSLTVFEKGERGVLEMEDEEFSRLKEKSASAAGKAFAILNDDRLSEVYSGSASKFFSDGEKMYESMLLDIASAEKYIFLEYFIIAEGEMWNEIYALLLKKAECGVEVRVIYDDIGCMKTLPLYYDKMLNSRGIKCMRFSPVTPRLSTAHNNRDHRKILIVDGRCAYTGGMNVADEYINRKNRFGHWKDGGIRIEGAAVKGFLKLFLSTWNFTAAKLSDSQKYFAAITVSEFSDGGFYIPFGSGPSPIYKRPVCKNALLNLINQAERYLYITTPYLIIDYDLTESLRNASLRGVDVRIITPGVADKKLVKVMTKSSYPYLMEVGVKIYEYYPGFIHEKSVVCDDLYALVGTVNLDYRSLAHHYEDAVWIYSSPTVLKVREEFEKTLSDSHEKEINSARLGPFEWCVRNLMRIFAPLL